ncbi:MAG TPA: DUF4097 family beta strand repeat-containing protein [Bryobacteraceae bacterium]|nr:DUF4097 family beta strand repeat-containing protein [Bryobacteraceae bacterium]
MSVALAAAQDKVTVPLSNPSQPATVKVSLVSGSITVTGGASGQVIVESGGAARENRTPRDVPQGMHRIDTGKPALDIVEDHNTVTIGSGHYMNEGRVTLQVPANASLQLKSVNGGRIEVSGVNGEIEVENINGSILLKDVSGSVVASSQNGSVTASLDRVTPNKPMSFTSLNGKIDVTIPADTKARLRLKTDNGDVYSDFDVKMEPDATRPVVEDSRGRDGRYRIRMDRNIYGSINGGGPEYRFETMNGNIIIHKK